MRNLFTAVAAAERSASDGDDAAVAASARSAASSAAAAVIDGGQGGGDVAFTPRAGWAAVRRQKDAIILSRRWHRGSDRLYKRLLHSFSRNHTLLAGLFFRGSLGFTRAQTVQILMNSLVLEIVVLCMQYESEDDVLTINLVQVIVAGVVAALICIPATILFMGLYNWQILINTAMWVVCLPCKIRDCSKSTAQTTAEVTKKGRQEGARVRLGVLDASRLSLAGAHHTAPAARPATRPAPHLAPRTPLFTPAARHEPDAIVHQRARS